MLKAHTTLGCCQLRDTLLSFTLPPQIVGVRRTILLPRAVNRHATEFCTNEVHRAHEMAMLGSEYVWANHNDEMHKTSVLLAGLGILFSPEPPPTDVTDTTTRVFDPVRDGDAYGGRVQLPWLQTIAPVKPGLSRLAFTPHTNTWTVYKVDGGKATVQLKAQGFEGLCTAVLLVTKKT